MHVNTFTAGGQKGSNAHICTAEAAHPAHHTAGARKRYIQHVYSAGSEQRDTPCTFTLYTVETDTPKRHPHVYTIGCTSTLLAVKMDAPSQTHSW